MPDNKITDNDLFNKMIEASVSGCTYWNGRYYHYDGLDVQHTNNMYIVDEMRHQQMQSSGTTTNP